MKLGEEKTHLTDDLIPPLKSGVDNSLHAMSDSLNELLTRRNHVNNIVHIARLELFP